MNIETILELAKQISFDLELGISTEIRHFLENRDGIKAFEISSKDKIFDIIIMLKDYDKSLVRDIFTELVIFIQYSSFTCYAMKANGNSIEYYLLSSCDDNTGFFCHIIFKH